MSRAGVRLIIVLSSLEAAERRPKARPCSITVAMGTAEARNLDLVLCHIGH